MNIEKFIQNVEELCKIRQISPTKACIESGVSRSFLTDVKNKSSSPRVDNIQKLAQYLGVTTSELLGEDCMKPTECQVMDILFVEDSSCSMPASSLSEEALAVAQSFDQADDKSRAMVRLALGLDDDMAIAARGGKVVKKPSPVSAETLGKLSRATEEAAKKENDQF